MNGSNMHQRYRRVRAIKVWLYLAKKALTHCLGSTFIDRANSKINCITIVWWATWCIKLCFWNIKCSVKETDNFSKQTDIILWKWAATWDFHQCGICDQQRLRSAWAFACRFNILCMLSYLQNIIWASTRGNLSPVVCQQKRRRPACTSTQSDQRLCYSLFGRYHT